MIHPPLVKAYENMRILIARKYYQSGSVLGRTPISIFSRVFSTDLWKQHQRSSCPYLNTRESIIFCAVLGLKYADGSAEYETTNHLSSLDVQACVCLASDRFPAIV
jgi:hypothetical protein